MVNEHHKEAARLIFESTEILNRLLTAENISCHHENILDEPINILIKAKAEIAKEFVISNRNICYECHKKIMQYVDDEIERYSNR